jgi:hypothetical protein
MRWCCFRDCWIHHVDRHVCVLLLQGSCPRGAHARQEPGTLYVCVCVCDMRVCVAPFMSISLLDAPHACLCVSAALIHLAERFHAIPQSPVRTVLVGEAC